MSLGVEALARCPEQWRRLRRDVDLGVATEGILRWATTLHNPGAPRPAMTCCTVGPSAAWN